MHFSLEKQGISSKKNSYEREIHRNASVSKLYQLALTEKGTTLANNGALIADSVPKTGRSPKDKRIVDEETSRDNVWWGNINIKLPEESFEANLELAQGFLNSRDRLYVVDGFAGWDTNYRIKVRVICTRAYHALFMWNMLIRPTEEELKNYGDPDWVVFNAGQMSADTHVEGVESSTSVDINFKKQEMVILGTDYAGEMKKGIFTVLNYMLPLEDVFPMHCSANEGSDGKTALFFGLSGTGKTTLSADPNRALIGDDEHGWSDKGIFNFEGGCYAKTIHLSRKKEPEIYDAIRFGAVLENVVYDPETFEVDYDDNSITENTRASYPIEHIANAKIPCTGEHPKNVIFLTCDAFGILPPVSRLTPGQAMYHFISGYTAKVAGTEMGIDEPQATFSPCFGAPFLVWHPTKYAELLKEKIDKHDATVWLVNTGWTEGAYGIGHRIELKHTRSIIHAILSGHLDDAEFEKDEVFGLSVPKTVDDVPEKILNPKNAWEDKESFDKNASKLAKLFIDNFKEYESEASEEMKKAQPKLAVEH